MTGRDGALPTTIGPSGESLVERSICALASPARRDLVTRSGDGPATVGELTQPLSISLPALSRHLSVLEGAGLLVHVREGRNVRCALVPDRLTEAERWLARHRQLWADGLDRLAAHLEEDA